MNRVFVVIASGVLALAASAALAQPAPASPPAPASAPRAPVMTEPNWVRRPSPEEIAKAIPKKAADAGMSGTATLACRVNAEGGLTGCAVAGEHPAGFDFGTAAMSLTGAYRMAPSVEGRSTAGASVMIPVVFRAFDASGRTRVTLLGNPHWKKTPTAAEVRAAYPAKAAGVAGGGAIVRCDFTPTGETRTCALRSEQPTGLGFGEAAQKLAREFVIDGGPLDAGVIGVVNADIPFAFHNPARPAVVQPISPQWTRVLTAEGAAALFPQAARVAGVLDGQARVDCAGAPNGGLTDCRVLEETPAGLGFGAAAIASAGQLTMNPWTVSGEPVDGRRVTLPFRFQLQAAKP